jgi:hypothetical protein
MEETPELRARELADIEALARLLDSRYELPLGLRVGWDGIIGLVPVIGSLLTTGVSGFIIIRGAAVGASPSVIARMLLNVVIDNGIAAVPVVGWAGDFVWKSNEKNVQLLRRHLADPEKVARRSRGYLTAVAAVVILLCIAFAVATLMLAWWVIGQFREVAPLW